MMMCRDLNFDDVKDLLNMKGNAFDVLAAVAGRGKRILEDHVAAMESKREKRSYCDDGEASTSITPPKKRKCNIILKFRLPSPPQSPPLPQEMDNLIREMARGKILTPPTLVIQKSLFKTDLSDGHNRFSIPMKMIRDDFLTDEEKRHVRAHDVVTMKKKYLEVKIIDPLLVTETVKFTRWDMAKRKGGRTSSSYIINGTWSEIVKRNNLQEKMGVQLWCFRVDQDLCFALVRLPPQNS